jgi:hypothetical protein
MAVTVQTLVTVTSILLNVKEVHLWFRSRSLEQKAGILWHVFMTTSDVLLATLWWCMRADPAFHSWTGGALAWYFWALLGLKTLSQFPVHLPAGGELPYLSACFAITLTVHFPFIFCVLASVGYDWQILCLTGVASVLSYAIYVVSELTFRLSAAQQQPQPAERRQWRTAQR